MNFSIGRILDGAALSALLLLTACGGGGGASGGGSSGTTTTPSYTIGGTVTGLSGSVVLQDNGGDNLTVTANGSFTFAGKIENNRTYAVTVLTQPTGQTCSVSTGAGTVSGNNVSNVNITCSTNAYTVGGTVSGLKGSIVLQNNSGNDLTIASDGNFTFSAAVAYGSPYAVSILTQPANQSCSIANGTGTIAAANVSNIAITCATNTYTVGGTVSGLSGSVVLQDNGADNYTVSVNGPFTFPTAIAYGNPYDVSVLTQPASQHCGVTSGAGTVAGNISNVGVACSNNQMGGAIQLGTALNLTPTVSTFAGTTTTLVDGTGAAARFHTPYASVSDGTNLYVADTGNNAIRKIVLATGVVTTLAGSPAGTPGAADGVGTAATFRDPKGITIDSSNANLYVADYGNHKIRKIVIATGVVSSVTGVANIQSGWGATDGAAATATFNFPAGITTDGTNLYVTDSSNNKIRQIAIATGAVSSLTGVANTTSATGATDGAAATALFNNPVGITTDGTNLYVADWGNNKIRQIAIANGGVSSMTGVADTAGAAGATDGAAATATFTGPIGIATDGTNLYVADGANNKIRQIVIATGVVSSFTGATNTASSSGAADGAGATATFSWPYGVTVNGANLYVADAGNNKIRQIVIGTGVVSSLAGANAGSDGIGAAAIFYLPQSVTTDGINLYVADTFNQIIRKIEIATGATTTLAGQVGVTGAVDGAGASARFNYPTGITTDGNNLYVTDAYNEIIRKIEIATGMTTTLAGQAGVYGSTDGLGAKASFDQPYGITTDGTNLYVVERANCRIRKIEIATGMVSSLTGMANPPGSAGAADGPGANATFYYPTGITTDGTNLYVADEQNHKIRKIEIATGMVSSLTGVASTPSAAGAADGAAATATFYFPTDLTTDGINLYVADQSNHKIRKIALATGVVSSVTGTANTASTPGAADGAGASASFNSPYGITTDGVSLYVTDQSNNVVRKIR